MTYLVVHDLLDGDDLLHDHDLLGGHDLLDGDDLLHGECGGHDEVECEVCEGIPAAGGGGVGREEGGLGAVQEGGDEACL